MNRKRIRENINKKFEAWIESIDNDEVKDAIKKDALVSGGAIVDLLQSQTPKDYDVYFRTKESLLKVAEYYAAKWNSDEDKTKVTVMDLSKFQPLSEEEANAKFATCGDDADDSDPYIALRAIVGHLYGQDRVYARVHGVNSNVTDPNVVDEYTDDASEQETKPKKEDLFKPIYWSPNALTLSGKIQIVLRFHGEIEKIHENYDFVHCTCSFDYFNRKVTLPANALESIINKELIYTGSKYPLCSIFRTRKFLKRGWIINAGQYVKMAVQLNDLDLTDYYTLSEQLVGVDSLHFLGLLDAIKQGKENNEMIDSAYLMRLVDNIFGRE